MEVFIEQRDNLKQLSDDLIGEAESFRARVMAADELSDLQTLKYQDILDKAGEIELAVDNMPEDADVEDED